MTTKSQSTTTKLEGSEPTLEPCPFCPYPTERYFAVRDVGWQRDREMTRRVVTVCSQCGAQGPAFGFMSFNNEGTAAQYWNTRVSANTVPTVDQQAIERNAVLGLIERFQREPNRSQGTINAFEWLRRQIEEGNHAHHAFEVAPANAGFCKADECLRCGLPPNALMHMACVAQAGATEMNTNDTDRAIKAAKDIVEKALAPHPRGMELLVNCAECGDILNAELCGSESGFSKQIFITTARCKCELAVSDEIADATCTRAFPCRYRDARQCAYDTMLGSQCPKICECKCHAAASTVAPEPQYLTINGQRRMVIPCPDGKPDCEVLHTAPAPSAAAQDERCKCGLDKDNPIHSFSTEWQPMHKFTPKSIERCLSEGEALTLDEVQE